MADLRSGIENAVKFFLMAWRGYFHVPLSQLALALRCSTVGLLLSSAATVRNFDCTRMEANFEASQQLFSLILWPCWCLLDKTKLVWLLPFDLVPSYQRQSIIATYLATLVLRWTYKRDSINNYIVLLCHHILALTIYRIRMWKLWILKYWFVYTDTDMHISRLWPRTMAVRCGGVVH